MRNWVCNRYDIRYRYFPNRLEISNFKNNPLISDKFSWKSLLTFSVIYYFMSVWTYGLSVASGLFMPSLLTG